MRWTLPLFNRNQGAIAAAKADVAAAHNKSALRISHFAMTLRKTLFATKRPRSAWLSIERESAIKPREIWTWFRQTYGYGRIPLLEVIAEQRRFH